MAVAVRLQASIRRGLVQRWQGHNHVGQSSWATGSGVSSAVSGGGMAPWGVRGAAGGHGLQLSTDDMYTSTGRAWTLGAGPTCYVLAMAQRTFGGPEARDEGARLGDGTCAMAAVGVPSWDVCARAGAGGRGKEANLG